jgi:hypothetical protein
LYRFSANKTAAMRSAASFCMPGIAWLYVSSVIDTELCPRRSLMIFGWMPADSPSVAWV